MSKRLDSSDEFRGKSGVYGHQLDKPRLDVDRNHFHPGQANTNEGYKNTNMNFSCDMSQAYSTQMNPSYLNANSTSHLTSSHGQDSSQGHRQSQGLPPYNNSLHMPPTQNIPPFAGMMPPGTCNPMQPNSFPNASSSYAQNQMANQMYSDRQFRDPGMQYPPQMYDTHGNMYMPPPPLLPPTLPQASYGSYPGLMPTQSGIVVPPNQEVKEQDDVSKSEVQKWVHNFAEERGYTNKDIKKELKIKVGETRDILQRWLQLLDELTSQRDKLMDLIKCGESEWQREIQQLNILKEKLINTQKEFSQVDIDNLNAELQKKRKKRKWQTKQKQVLAQEKLDSEKKKFELHLRIDHWRDNEIAKDQAKNKAASMKQEAGGLLGEIRRKQTDSSKSLNLLLALTKLRNFRKQEGELKGVYPKPVAEQNKYFNEKIAFLEKIMKKHHELYESEEKTLVVMLAEEEEEKEKERREKKQRKQLAQAASSDSSDPMRDFYRYYTQADNGLDSLVHIRHGWDMYIVPDSIPGASCIPQSSISAVEPCSDHWASMVMDKG
ncbi:programmed cell death protein 7-like [Actinia tenebrosa]|uniref:Programmed cell death protein 7-like n=1 Tax=Actinia tenebrosa TaxID=6105 RepID=A0A6P8IDQ8_ACTTE|nr:programmed cell death protein 7-like [Actinia tenebrosa]